jgi:uncharacterized protein DUF397
MGSDMNSKTLQQLEWHKSSRSVANGACVEVAVAPSRTIQLRDSKNPSGSILSYSPAAWAAFIENIKADRFSRQ